MWRGWNSLAVMWVHQLFQAGSAPSTDIRLTDSDGWQARLDSDGDGAASLARVPPPVPVDKQDLRRRRVRIFPRLFEQRHKEVRLAEREVRVYVRGGRKVDHFRKGLYHLQMDGRMSPRTWIPHSRD